jgi:hypothetical protein
LLDHDLARSAIPMPVVTFTSEKGEYYSCLCPCSAQVFAAFGERDYRIVWRGDSSNESGLRCPLSAFPDWDDAYYELQLHVANDYVYHTSELISAFN